MATGAIVSIRSLSKAFRDQEPIFDNFSLEVAAGEICALIGPSGAGKTTLLRLLSGIDDQFTGTIDIDGIPAQKAQRIGYVFQDPRLLPWETAVENIRVVNPDISVAEAETLLRDFGLEGFEHAYPHALSGGMKRRVALARCMSLKPRLMLLDEPFVSLDQRLVEDLTQLIAKVIAQSGATVFLVTHDLMDVDRIASRLIHVAGRPLQIVEDRRLGPRAQKGELT